jgi:pimeloyl-ACP methyl ester carboxylesterase
MFEIATPTTDHTARPSHSTAVRLPVVEHGRRDGIPVVLLHGLSDSLHSFEPLFPYLPPSLRTLALTQRGHGDAPKPHDGYSAEQMAADVLRAMDDAGVVRAVVAGHSMGSIVASRLALDAPDRLAGLVLMGAKPTFNVPELEELFEVFGALEDPVDPAFVREFQESTLARPVAPDFLDAVVAESLKLPARVWRSLVESALRADHSARLGRISVPTLVAWGDRDDVAVRADQDALIAAIPSTWFALYEGAGHAFHWEDPATFAHDLTTFAFVCARALQRSA